MHPSSRIKLTLTEEMPPLIASIPFKRAKIAAVMLTNSPELQTPVDLPGLIGTYVVENALPVAYKRDWPTENRTPGICLLTLFRKRTSIDHDEFIDRWHNGHTPLSLEIHPLWHYSRNVVVESSGTHYDGIVEEHCLKRSDMINPFKFYGGPARMLPNMLRVYRDVKGFLDYPSIEPYMVSEYYFH